MKVTKSQIQGAVATLAVHAVAVVLLLLLVMRTPQLEAESGIPVMLGNTELAQGHTESYQFTEVSSVKSDVPNIENAPQTQPKPQVEEPLITQPDEPTVEMPTPEEIEAQKRAEAERLAEAERVVQQKVASAFSKGFEMGSKGTAEEAAAEGTQGTQEGVAGADKAVGIGVQGTFDLNGRSLLGEGLPQPIVDDVDEEAMIVVTIEVNPAGEVVATRINLRTRSANLKLREAAEKAAKRARFNKVDGVSNVQGTITYFFKLK